MLSLFFAFAFSAPRRPVIKKSSSNDIDNFACRICSGVLTGVRDLKTRYETESEISTNLLKQCDMLTQLDSDYLPMCQEMATTYVKLLIHLTDKPLEDTAICVKLGYCIDDEDSLKRNFKRLEANKKLITNKSNKLLGESCDECENFFAWAKSRGALTVLGLYTMIESTCPVKYSEICSKVNLFNIEKIFDLVNSRVENRVACELTNLCN
ncbi:hypothetical protein TRFO_20893 [Tritrichomonas foetus]|uniref:Saposin B-type domain-containing protein n=1 Tax=Tritrichomonas foetus TaxID=1144522 RepID=A0A1J4KKU5_9EUKA|nr:hypothetical protein TRFO_20893 [Tritrichomonas foetus]|eukprot:OHT09997.1 hypothetical protein TRFO_20893 [Tritrichomonas foetus]